MGRKLTRQNRPANYTDRQNNYISLLATGLQQELLARIKRLIIKFTIFHV